MVMQCCATISSIMKRCWNQPNVPFIRYCEVSGASSHDSQSSEQVGARWNFTFAWIADLLTFENKKWNLVPKPRIPQAIFPKLLYALFLITLSTVALQMLFDWASPATPKHGHPHEDDITIERDISELLHHKYIQIASFAQTLIRWS